MRIAEVYYNSIPAGILTEVHKNEFVFRYNDAYFNDKTQPAISLTLPKTRQEYQSSFLFPFFFNMLSEGSNRKLQRRMLKIDEDDNFGILLATAFCDTVGAVTVKSVSTQ